MQVKWTLTYFPSDGWRSVLRLLHLNECCSQYAENNLIPSSTSANIWPCENISDDIAHSNMCQSYISFQGYIENAPQCSGHGTYMCGICQCAPDFFGRRCECDAENLSFHGDLEAGCRPDNTTTTLCKFRVWAPNMSGLVLVAELGPKHNPCQCP